MSSGPFVERQKSESLDIPPRRVEITDPSQLPSDFSTTPGGTIFSTTPGGTYSLPYVRKCKCFLEIIFCIVRFSLSISIKITFSFVDELILKHVLSQLTRDLINLICTRLHFLFAVDLCVQKLMSTQQNIFTMLMQLCNK